MAYGSAKGRIFRGDIYAEDDPNQDTYIDWGNDFISFGVGGVKVLNVSASNTLVQVLGNVSASLNITASGHVSASAFYGDGQYLQNVGAGSGGGIFTTLASGDAFTTSSIRVGSTGEASASLYVSGTGAGAGPVFRLDSSVAGGTPLFFVSGSGLVGIGTATPGATLHVSSSGDGALFRVDGANETEPLLFVTGSGIVGIGTSTPSLAASGDTKLDINGHLRVGRSGTGYIFANNDNDTAIKFGGSGIPGNDGISFICGNKTMLILDENASTADSIILGNAAADLIIVSGSLIVSGSISGSTTIQGASLSVDGAVTGGSLTDGTATISTGAVSGVTTINASGLITAGSLTDGTATISNGTIAGGTSYSGSTTIQGASLSVDGAVTGGGLQILDGSGGLIFSASAGGGYAGLSGNGVVSRRAITISGSSGTGLLVDSIFDGGVGIAAIGHILAGHTGAGVHTARLHSDGSISGSAGLTMGTTGVFGSDVGIRTTTPTEALDINSDAIRIRTAQTPASAAATGTVGMVCWDSNYIYICIATDTWKRVAIGTW